MADNRALFLMVPFLLLPGLLRGQEPGPSAGGSFYIDRSGEEERFIQRLVWERADYAYRYEIALEARDDSGAYAEIRREFRTENFIELSLVPGLYRYRITVYNLLNRPAGSSQWIYFRVLPALQPELYSFTQEFLPSGEGGTALVLQGKNLQEGAELYLRPMEPGGDPVAPLASVTEGDRARLVFDRESLAPGRYRAHIRNPGGLETSLDITVMPPPPVVDDGAPAGVDDAPAAEIAAADTTGPETAAAEEGDADTATEAAGIADAGAAEGSTADAADAGAVPPRFFDLNISAGYAPLIPLYGYLFDPFNGLYPLGFSARLEFIPFRRSWGDLGVELAPSWNMLRADATKMQMGTVYLNGLYQWWFPNQAMALIFRLGGGVGLFYGTRDSGLSSGSIFTWVLSVDGGIAFRWYVKTIQNFRRKSPSSLYVEIGLEYGHFFAADSPQPGYIRPVLGLGWRF
jgi:hypothetical protein